MSMYRKLSDLFGRHSFDRHTAAALALAEASAQQHPTTLPGCAPDTPPLRLVTAGGGCGGRSVAPEPDSPGATDHQRPEWPINWDRLRGDFATLRELCVALADTAHDIAGHIDRIDPTAAGLARAHAQRN